MYQSKAFENESAIQNHKNVIYFKIILLLKKKTLFLSLEEKAYAVCACFSHSNSCLHQLLPGYTQTSHLPPRKLHTVSVCNSDSQLPCPHDIWVKDTCCCWPFSTPVDCWSVSPASFLLFPMSFSQPSAWTCPNLSASHHRVCLAVWAP